MAGEEELERSEGEALLSARAELGPGFEAELVDGFAERIERVVRERAEAERRRHDDVARRAAAAGPRQLALAIVSLVSFIPLGITLGVNGEGFALLVTLAAIVAVNLAHAWQSRPS
ncbi:hypothetical protein [Nocardioides solisilvae]|uniref:hypothetical protein n=1 Tax=Nocardioides solisilvae TaxID=1542435 RepID=UPI0013A52F40|nr:hypothetical protein [Nocardioides solisilvae]